MLGACSPSPSAGSVDPKERLAQGEVSYDFFVGGIGFEGFPEVQVFGFVVGLACEEEGGGADWPEFVEHYVGLVRPFGFVLDVGVDEFCGLFEVAAVGGGEGPEVVFLGG